MLFNKILPILVFLLLGITTIQAEEPVKFTPRNKTPDEIYGYLDNAVKLIEEKGPAAYAELTDPNGPWADGDWYLYINNYDGYNVAHANKSMIGKYFFSVRDKMGHAFFAELQKAAMSPSGRGWVEFWWPKPGETEPARKIGFVVGIPKQRLWIGTGAYDMTDEEINRLSNPTSSD